jgi:hypothetical protein
MKYTITIKRTVEQTEEVIIHASTPEEAMRCYFRPEENKGGRTIVENERILDWELEMKPTK